MNSSFVFKENFSLNSLASFLTLSGVFIIFFSPFWWPSSNTNAVALIRVFVFLSAFIFIVKAIFGFFKTEVNLKINTSIILLFLLFFYLIFNAYLLASDTQPIRRVAFLLILFVSIYFLDVKPAVARGFLILLAFSGFCFAAYSIASMYNLDLLPTGYRKDKLFQSANPNIAYFGNTIVAAMHYAITFSILSYLFLTESKRLFLFIWLAFLAVVAVYIMFTFSRAGWVACAVAFMSIYFLTFDKVKFRFYFLLVVLLSLLVYFSLNFLQYELFNRGLRYRDEIWQVVLSRMPGHWLFGYGLSTPFEPIPTQGGKVFVWNSHNVYLEILYQVGVVGLALFIVLVMNSLYVLYKRIKSSMAGDVSILFFSILLSVLVVMTTELNSWVSTPNLLWQWLWLPLAFSLNLSKKLNVIN